jgi:hypothetical protein
LHVVGTGAGNGQTSDLNLKDLKTVLGQAAAALGDKDASDASVRSYRALARLFILGVTADHLSSSAFEATGPLTQSDAGPDQSFVTMLQKVAYSIPEIDARELVVAISAVGATIAPEQSPKPKVTRRQIPSRPGKNGRGKANGKPSGLIEAG